MAPKKKSEGDGILAKVMRMFEAGELNISVDSALEKFLRVRDIKGVEGAMRVASLYMWTRTANCVHRLGCILLASWSGIQRLIRVFM